MLFSCIYNAPVSFYALLLQSDEDVLIEQYDHYIKQSYRNRCRIVGANGIIDLVIPVVKNHGKKTLMKDVRIDYDSKWNKIHWRSIFSAYASAPFYEFMEEFFVSFYEKKYTFLLDLNLEILHSTIEILECKKNIQLTTDYLHTPSINDYRDLIHPKKKLTHPLYTFHPAEYHQVFSDRHSFCPDLSILDLLFNVGPEARMILRKSVH